MMESYKILELTPTEKEDNNPITKIKDSIISIFFIAPLTRFINELPQWLFILILCAAVIIAINYLIKPNWKSIEFLFMNIISKYKWWDNIKLKTFHSKFINILIYITGFVIGLLIINLFILESNTDRIIWSMYYFYLLCINIIELMKTQEQINYRSIIFNTIINFLYVIIFCVIFSVLIPRLPIILTRIFFIILCLYFFVKRFIEIIKSKKNIIFRSYVIYILFTIYFLLLLLNYTYNMNIIYYPINSISKLFTGKAVFGEWIEYERGVLGLYKTNGYRIYKSPNGYISEGYFKNNMLNGEGNFRYANGCCVEVGFFVNGRLNGEGKITHEHSGITEGYFIDSILNGEGKIIYKSGCYDEGYFINGKLNGIGKQKHIITDGYYFEEGYFVDNILNGEGKGTYVINDKCLIEEGMFLEGKFNKGIVSYPGGSMFEGTYINGYANKEGKLYYKSGRIEEGLFIDGWLSNGKRIYANGETEEGSFVEGLLNNGKRIYVDGSIYEGSFVYGEIMEGKGRIILPNEDVRIIVFNMGNIYEIPTNIHRRNYDEDYTQMDFVSRPSGRF